MSYEVKRPHPLPPRRGQGAALANIRDRAAQYFKKGDGVEAYRAAIKHASLELRAEGAFKGPKKPHRPRPNKGERIARAEARLENAIRGKSKPTSRYPEGKFEARVRAVRAGVSMALAKGGPRKTPRAGFAHPTKKQLAKPEFAPYTPLYA